MLPSPQENNGNNSIEFRDKMYILLKVISCVFFGTQSNKYQIYKKYLQNEATCIPEVNGIFLN